MKVEIGHIGATKSNFFTATTTAVVRFRDGYAVVFNGRLAMARWIERGPAEAQLSLLRSGYSMILKDGTIRHAPPRTMSTDQIEKVAIALNHAVDRRGLWDVLSWSTISKENYCGSFYWEWEDKVCRPALESLGYRHITFHMGECDSFGPLSRVVHAQKDGVRTEFVYG